MTTRLEKALTIGKFDWFELVTVWYYSDDTETKWQVENNEWFNNVMEFGSIWTYFVNVKENKWFYVWNNYVEKFMLSLLSEKETNKLYNDWDSLMDVAKKVFESNMTSFEMMDTIEKALITFDKTELFEALYKVTKELWAE